MRHEMEGRVFSEKREVLLDHRSKSRGLGIYIMVTALTVSIGKG
jgi:hypothetical protein